MWRCRQHPAFSLFPILPHLAPKLQTLNPPPAQQAWALFPGPLTQTARNRVRRQAPLSEGGEVAVPLLVLGVALLRGHQALDTSLMWAGWWEGRVRDNASLVVAPSWQVEECVQREEGKPAPFLNLQAVADAGEAARWCAHAAREYASAWAEGMLGCLCEEMPVGAACGGEAWGGGRGAVMGPGALGV